MPSHFIGISPLGPYILFFVRGSTPLAPDGAKYVIFYDYIYSYRLIDLHILYLYIYMHILHWPVGKHIYT